MGVAVGSGVLVAVGVAVGGGVGEGNIVFKTTSVVGVFGTLIKVGMACGDGVAVDNGWAVFVAVGASATAWLFAIGVSLLRCASA